MHFRSQYFSIRCFIFLLVSISSAPAFAETCSAKLPDSSVYVGECENGLFNGNGKLTWRDKSYYEGSFKDGLLHGKGKYVNSKGAWKAIMWMVR